jgi:tetratricopeptide (TPR) repeat protein
MIRKALEVERLRRGDDPDAEEDNPAFMDSLGWVLYRRGNVEEARIWLEKAAAHHLGADDPTVWDHLGDVYLRLNLIDQAAEAWRKALKAYEHDYRGRKEGRQEEVGRKLRLVSSKN